MSDIPMIYTIKGNLPIAALEYSTHWTDDKDYVKLVEVYRLDGEIVRESAHVLTRRGMFAAAETQTL